MTLDLMMKVKTWTLDSENVMVSIEKELANSYYKEAGQNVEEEDEPCCKLKSAE